MVIARIWAITILVGFGLFPTKSWAQEAATLVCGPPLAERLEIYFSRSEARAQHIVNNDPYPGSPKSQKQKIKLGDVVLEWIVTPKDKYDADISIKINGFRIKLQDLKPMNLADEDQPIDPELLSTWDQIRLYDYGDDRKILAVTLRPGMCTGLMCSVAAQLYFDLKTKHTSLFGSYRTDGEAKLYSFGQDGNEAFVVATNFSGDPHGVTSEAIMTYELYRLLSNGQFERFGNAAGGKYYIKHIKQPEASDKGDLVEERWIERIRLNR